tara:strand:+ start:155 stop:430 length:276 start_codon:yes stop_codon:yes gene_type:complete
MIANIPDRWVRSLASEMRGMEELDITIYTDDIELGFFADQGVFRLHVGEQEEQCYFSIDQLPRPQQILMVLAICDVLSMHSDMLLDEWPEA